MKNILSIDVDWVGDNRQFESIVKVVLPIIENNTFNRVILANTHSSIQELIDEYREPVNVVNVDHHHDILYLNAPLSAGLLPANWLGHNIKNKKVANAKWIANYNSDMCTLEDDTGYFFRDVDVVIDISFDLEDITNYTYDSLFVCASPSYIHNVPEAQSTWILLKTILEQKLGG